MQFYFFIVLPVCSVETFSSARSSPWRSCSWRACVQGQRSRLKNHPCDGELRSNQLHESLWYLQVSLRCHSGVNPAPLCAPGLDPSQRQGVEELISAAPSRFDHAALFTILQKHTLLHRMNDSFSCLVSHTHTHTHWALHYPQCSWASGERKLLPGRGKLSGTAVYIWSTSIEAGLLIPNTIIDSYHNNLYWLPEQSLFILTDLYYINNESWAVCAIRCQNQSVLKINR